MLENDLWAETREKYYYIFRALNQVKTYLQ